MRSGFLGWFSSFAFRLVEGLGPVGGVSACGAWFLLWSRRFGVGVKGPVPKRSEDRHRRNSPEPSRIVVSGGAAPQPEGDPLWCPAAQRLWRAWGESGQSRFFQASDWAFAQFLCDELTYYLSFKRHNGQILAQIMSGLSSLLTTEGDRRRVQVELVAEDPKAGSGSVEVMAEWKSRLSRMS